MEFYVIFFLQETDYITVLNFILHLISRGDIGAESESETESDDGYPIDVIGLGPSSSLLGSQPQGVSHEEGQSASADQVYWSQSESAAVPPTPDKRERKFLVSLIKVLFCNDDLKKIAIKFIHSCCSRAKNSNKRNVCLSIT